jgi:hypothetical protein
MLAAYIRPKLKLYVVIADTSAVDSDVPNYFICHSSTI